ncbi:MAG: SgcJ/EcaC family oxidoreductase [Planctomycetota bacterium]
MSDEDEIRATIERWLLATREGDTAALAAMLDDEVLFVVPGQPPFGKREFFAGPPSRPARFDWQVEVREVVVNGDWALTRVQLGLELVPAEGAAPLALAGPTLSVWRRTASGGWAIWRDANMVAPVAREA